MSKTVGFLQKHLCERGTTIALYDYAVANEEVCDNISIIFYQSSNSLNVPDVVEKFKKRFIVIEYVSWKDIEKHIDKLGLDYLYVIKYGFKDESITTKIPCLIHSVFTWDPHGNYASVSHRIAHENKGEWLPHIVKPLPTSLNGKKAFRKRYNIPDSAYVYGRHGGKDTFSIEYTKEAIREEIDSHPNVWFVFVNTNKFIEHPRVLFLPKIIDDLDKGDFINACDAMIHGRLEGETFGLAIAEFISLGKPVLSCPAIITNDNEHLYLGKDWVKVYHSKKELNQLLWNTPVLVPITENPYLEYSPENVMRKFGQILGDDKNFTSL